MRRRASCGVGALLLVTSGCGSDGGSEPVDPAARAAVVVTDGCGDASGGRSSGVLVIDDRVVTAAHVVVGASTVRVESPDGTTRNAQVEALDTESDVAVLRVAGAPVDAVRFTSFERGEVVRMVGGATSGTVELVTRRRARIEIEEVRSSDRGTRDGYELGGVTGDGDSGAGVYASDRRLGAIVFGESDERAGVTYAVAASEIDRLLDVPPASHECDAARSRLVRVDP